MKKATFTFGDSLGDEDRVASTPIAKPHFTSFKMKYRDPLDILNTCMQSKYTEVQYHNQLVFDDIESVHMTPSIEDWRSSDGRFGDINKMIEIGRQTNVPIIIFNKK